MGRREGRGEVGDVEAGVCEDTDGGGFGNVATDGAICPEGDVAAGPGVAGAGVKLGAARRAPALGSGVKLAPASGSVCLRELASSKRW